MAEAFQLTAQVVLKGPDVNKLKGDLERKLKGKLVYPIRFKLPAAADLRKAIKKKLGSLQYNVRLTFPKNVKTDVDAVTGSFEKLTKQISNTALTKDKFINNLKTLQKNLNLTVRQQQKATTSTQKNAKSMKEGEKAAQSFAHGIFLAGSRYAKFVIATGGAVIALRELKEGLSQAVEFERSLLRVAQVGGVSLKTIRGLGSEIRDVAIQYGVAGQELAEIGLILKQSGFSMEKVGQLLPVFAKAKLSPTISNLQDVANAVILLQRFGQTDVGELERSLSAINTIAGQFPVEAQDLITGLSRAGGAFLNTSDRVRELLSLLGTLRATTRESAQALGVSLRTVITRLQRLRSIQTARKLGVEFVEGGQFVGVFEAFKRLSEAQKRFQGRGQNLFFTQQLEQIVGLRQVSRMSSLIQNMAMAQEMLIASQKEGNTLAKDAATAQEALAVQLTKVRERLSKVFDEFLASDRVREFTRSIIDGGNALISFVSKLDNVAGSLADVAPLLAVLFASNRLGGFIQAGKLPGGKLPSASANWAGVGGKTGFFKNTVKTFGPRVDTPRNLRLSQPLMGHMGMSFVNQPRILQRRFTPWRGIKGLAGRMGEGLGQAGQALGRLGPGAMVGGAVGAQVIAQQFEKLEHPIAHGILTGVTNGLLVGMVNPLAGAAVGVTSAFNELIDTLADKDIAKLFAGMEQELINFKFGLREAGGSKEEIRNLVLGRIRSIRTRLGRAESFEPSTASFVKAYRQSGGWARKWLTPIQMINEFARGEGGGISRDIRQQIRLQAREKIVGQTLSTPEGRQLLTETRDTFATLFKSFKEFEADELGSQLISLAVEAGINEQAFIKNTKEIIANAQTVRDNTKILQTSQQFLSAGTFALRSRLNRQPRLRDITNPQGSTAALFGNVGNTSQIREGLNRLGVNRGQRSWGIGISSVIQGLTARGTVGDDVTNANIQKDISNRLINSLYLEGIDKEVRESLNSLVTEAFEGASSMENVIKKFETLTSGRIEALRKTAQREDEERQNIIRNLRSYYSQAQTTRGAISAARGAEFALEETRSRFANRFALPKMGFRGVDVGNIDDIIMQLRRVTAEYVRTQDQELLPVVDDLKNRLRLLADTSTRLKNAQEILSKLEERRQARLSLRGSYFGADIQQRQQMLRNAMMARLAVKVGDLRKLSPWQQQGAMRGFQSLGNIQNLFGTGKSRDQLLDELLSKSGGRLPEDMQIKRAQEKVLAAMTEAAKAQRELAEQEKQMQALFFNNLAQQHGSFLQRLEAILKGFGGGKVAGNGPFVPENVQHKFNGQVAVNINGHQVMGELQDAIGDIVNKAVAQAVKDTVNPVTGETKEQNPVGNWRGHRSRPWWELQPHTTWKPNV